MKASGRWIMIVADPLEIGGECRVQPSNTIAR